MSKGIGKFFKEMNFKNELTAVAWFKENMDSHDELLIIEVHNEYDCLQFSEQMDCMTFIDYFKEWKIKK